MNGENVEKVYRRCLKRERDRERHWRNTPQGRFESSFVRIGDGSIDWPRVRRMIEFVGYNGWVSIESSGWTDAEHSEIMDRFFNGSLKGGAGLTA